MWETKENANKLKRDYALTFSCVALSASLAELEADGNLKRGISKTEKDFNEILKIQIKKYSLCRISCIHVGNALKSERLLRFQILKILI